MPRYMRTACLLSLRDQYGAGLLPVFHAPASPRCAEWPKRWA